MACLHRIRVSTAAAFLAVAAFACSASALPPSSALKSGKTGVGAELHAAKALLEKADHDYEGHRAKAAHHIAEALHDLHGGSKNGKPHTAGKPHPKQGKSSGQKLKEPQNVSDAQLRDAAKLLADAELKLRATHPKARAQVLEAIGEIQIALKIK